MTKLTFYRQCRRDGAIRTGIEVDGEAVLGRFESGTQEEEDSALEWWVDVRCSVSELFNDPAAARKWFLDHGGAIQAALEELSGELSIGMDFAPISRNIANGPGTAKIRIVCSAVRRVTAHRMAEILADIKNRWFELIEGLSVLEPA